MLSEPQYRHVLEIDCSAVRIGAHGIVKMAVVCTLCNPPKERYRLREGIQKGGGLTELYRQLRTVVDDLPARLCSEVVCVSCRGSILKATKQKEHFECSRKELVQKLHKSSSVPACNTK